MHNERNRVTTHRLQSYSKHDDQTCPDNEQKKNKNKLSRMLSSTKKKMFAKKREKKNS